MDAVGCELLTRGPIAELDETFAYSNDEPPPGMGWIRMPPRHRSFVSGREVRMYHCGASKQGMGVGMVTWRRDGFVSLHVGSEGGELVTRAFIPTGRSFI